MFCRHCKIGQPKVAGDLECPECGRQLYDTIEDVEPEKKVTKKSSPKKPKE